MYKHIYGFATQIIMWYYCDGYLICKWKKQRNTNWHNVYILKPNVEY